MGLRLASPVCRQELEKREAHMKRSLVRKQSSIKQTVFAAGLALFFGGLLFGCGRSSAPVPIDCQAFLDKYFEAVKAKDVATLQNLISAFWNWGGEGMPQSEASMEKTREVRNMMFAENFKGMTEMFGDFKSYSVSSVKVTKVPEDRPATEVFRPGIHAEIECKAKFSKQSPVRISLHLFKETQGSEYSLLLWKYLAEP